MNDAPTPERATPARGSRTAVRRVLMLTYAFPPATYVGGMRTLKYCRFLHCFGWQPIVLTIDPRGVASLDNTLTQQIPPDVVVHRTWDIDPAKYVDRLPVPRRSAPEPAGRPPTGAPALAGGSTVKSRFKRLARALLLESPDSHLFWVPFAVARGMRSLLTQSVDVVYSSSPPHSTHAAAMLLARLFRKPHVVDLRDPWSTPGGDSAPADVVIRGLRRLQAKLRWSVFRRAARIIVVSNGEREELLALLPDLDPQRVAVITNGFDPSDFGTASPATPRTDDVLRMTHAGTIYPGTATELFEAIEALVESNPLVRDRLRLTLLGSIDPQYSSAVERLKACGVVTAPGVVPHREAIEVMSQSDVLLILLGGGAFPPSEIPSKAFEYMFAGKAILAVAAPGDLTTLLARSGLGVSTAPFDSTGLSRAIAQLMDERQTGTLAREPDAQFIAQFDRRRLTATLARHFDELVLRRAAAVAAPRTPWN